MTSERYPKTLRQKAIRDIIAASPVRTQEDLAERLAERGVSATQATVSRDLVELGVMRVPLAGQGLVYMLGEKANVAQIEAARRRLRLVLTEAPGDVGMARAVMVYRTAPGMANLVAITLDACAFPEIVGTVAGDDTIFIALRHADDQATVEALLPGASASLAGS